MQTTQAGIDIAKAVFEVALSEPLFVTVRVSTRKTMEYHSFHTGGSPGGFGHLDFEDGFVTGVYVSAPEERVHEYALDLDERPFASMSGVMIVSFPLDAGVEFVYPGFGWGGTTNPAMRWRSVEVVGREVIDLLDAQASAWKVRTGNNLVWLSREAPYFLKAEPAPGNQGTRFEIVSWAPM